MRNSILLVIFTALVCTHVLTFQADAAPAGPLIKHLSSVIKWTRSTTSKSTQSGIGDANLGAGLFGFYVPRAEVTGVVCHADPDFLQFEGGYLVETVAQGNDLGVVPYSIRVSQDGELYAVDAVNSNIIKITPPLSQYSRARLVAGSFQGHTGHVDGKPSEARFNRPKGVTMDDKGNVYVADTVNLSVRKIGDSGVTTIAGGKSNVAGFRDGPSEDAKFSSDFDVVYVRATCSLLVIDRGNAALRQIALDQEDCYSEDNSISTADVMMVIGAVLVGYVTCLLQQGFGPSFFFRTQQPSQVEFQTEPAKEKSVPLVESIKEEPVAGWPSFGQLIADLSKLALEALAAIFLSVVPSHFQAKKGLTPLKDHLKMPEDEVEPRSVHKQRAPAPVSETRQIHSQNTGNTFSEMKTSKLKSSSFKDPSLSSKHRSSKRQQYDEFYGSADAPAYGQARSKSTKERTRHRQRDKSGEVGFGAAGTEPKPAEMKAVNYEDPNFSHYNFRGKYGPDDSFRF